MFAAFLVQLLVAVVVAAAAFLLAPKPKTPKPEAAKDMELPTSEAGRPLPVVFGTVTVRGLNVLWYGDKSVKEYNVNA